MFFGFRFETLDYKYHHLISSNSFFFQFEK
jgi:hypothetical protein